MIQAGETRCGTCHRVEVVHPDGRTEIVSEGGSRRPDGRPELAAWRVVRSALEAGHRVVGPCPVCGQPRLAAGPGSHEPWRWSLPGRGDLELGADGVMRLAGGVVDPEELDDAVAAVWPPPPLPVVRDALRSSLLLLFAVPIAIWFFVLSFVIMFLTTLGTASFQMDPP